MKTHLKCVPPTFGDTDILTTRQLDLALQTWWRRVYRRHLGWEGRGTPSSSEVSTGSHSLDWRVREPPIISILSSLSIGDR